MCVFLGNSFNIDVFKRPVAWSGKSSQHKFFTWVEKDPADICVEEDWSN